MEVYVCVCGDVWVGYVNCWMFIALHVTCDAVPDISSTIHWLCCVCNIMLLYVISHVVLVLGGKWVNEDSDIDVEDNGNAQVEDLIVDGE